MGSGKIVALIMWKGEAEEEEGMMGMLSTPHCWIAVLAVVTLLMLFDAVVLYQYACLFIVVQLLVQVAVKVVRHILLYTTAVIHLSTCMDILK